MAGEEGEFCAELCRQAAAAGLSLGRILIVFHDGKWLHTTTVLPGEVIGQSRLSIAQQAEMKLERIRNQIQHAQASEKQQYPRLAH